VQSYAGDSFDMAMAELWHGDTVERNYLTIVTFNGKFGMGAD